MLTIRPEAPADIEAVRSVEEAAFGRPDEAGLVDRLRADGDLVLSLIATQGQLVVGHVALSRMEAPFAAVGLGPVATLPDRQRAGIGQSLIKEAIAWARGAGWEAMFVLGDPAYYERFGFDAAAAAGFSSPYAGPYLMVLALSDGLPETRGRIEYAPAFGALS
jgi:putative acetyltransferase